MELIEPTLKHSIFRTRYVIGRYFVSSFLFLALKGTLGHFEEYKDRTE